MHLLPSVSTCRVTTERRDFALCMTVCMYSRKKMERLMLVFTSNECQLTLSLPEATIVDHIPWLPLATIGTVFTQYMWVGLSLSWQPEILCQCHKKLESRPHILHKYGAYSRQRQPQNVVDYNCLQQRKS